MKIGNRVKVRTMEFFKDSESGKPIKRPKKLLGKEGEIIDINLGIFKVEFESGEVEYFDGREIDICERLKSVRADFAFVTWQKDGRSVYDTKEGEQFFAGDFHRGTRFKGTIELDSEEIARIQEAEEKGIKPSFDLFIVEGDRRKRRR